MRPHPLGNGQPNGPVEAHAAGLPVRTRAKGIEMQQDGITPGEVVLAASLVERIAALPAIATHAWCDDAASTLLPLRVGCIVCLTLGVVDEQGRFRRVEEVGAASDTTERGALAPLRERLNVIPRLGWSMGDPAQLTAGALCRRVVEIVEAKEWSDSGQGRLWASLGVGDLLVAAAPVASGAPSRVIISEIGLTHPTQTFSAPEAAVLAAAMGPLSRRARLAFGDDVGEPVRRLTPREEEVLEHLALGKSVRQIATELRRSPHTVHDHVKSLHVKLHATSRGELIARALGHLKSGRRQAAQDRQAVGAAESGD